MGYEAGFKFGFGRFVRVVKDGFEIIKNKPPRRMDLLKNWPLLVGFDSKTNRIGECFAQKQTFEAGLRKQYIMPIVKSKDLHTKSDLRGEENVCYNEEND